MTAKEMVSQSMQRQRKHVDKRLELSANKKRLVAEDLQSEKQSFVSQTDLWSAMQAKRGMSKKQLSNLLRKREQYKQLSQKPLESKHARNKQRVRASGARRKQPYPQVVAAVAQWLALERSFGHTISKPDVLAEFAAQVRLSATEGRKKAEDPKLSVSQASELVNKATEKEDRLRKLSDKSSYRVTFVRRLLKWMGAKFTTTKELEAEVRRKLTWQELDHRLLLASLSPLATLSAEKVVVDPENFADQVPLWAKATGRKAVFAQPELHLPQHRADFSEVRQALAEFESLATPLSDSTASLESSADSKTPQLAKALSTDKSTAALLPAEQEPEAALAAEAQAAAEAGAAAKAEAPVSVKALRTAGSFTVRASQRMSAFASPMRPDKCSSMSVAQAQSPFQVMPGQWARLSNISEDGKWLKTESFRVGAKTITHLA